MTVPLIAAELDCAFAEAETMVNRIAVTTEIHNWTDRGGVPAGCVPEPEKGGGTVSKERTNFTQSSLKCCDSRHDLSKR